MQDETFIEVPGGRLFAVVDGDPGAPPILLVHSAIVDLRSWDEMTPHLVAAGYRVVRYDMRGYGRSTTEDVEFSNRADLRAVLDHLAIERAPVVGNSYAAIISLDAALETPERFAALVWVGGGVSGFEGTYNDAEDALFGAYDEAEQQGDVAAMADLDVRIWVDGVGQPETRVPSTLRESVRAMDTPRVDPRRVAGTPRPLEPRAEERLEQLTVPTLVVVGELDTVGTRESALRLAERAQNATLISWPDVAHLIGMEVPDRLVAAIVEFLAPLPGWA